MTAAVPGSTRSRFVSPWMVGAVALTLTSLMALQVLSEADWDATLFGAFGVEATATTEYAEERLGDVFLRNQHGHDGKTFFVLANDPWLLNPAENVLILEHPVYRSQRMLYPLVAGGAGFFGPEIIIWSLLIVNLIALGVGSWAVADIARSMGGSSWWGLAFVLNLGFISALIVGGADIVAGAMAFWGVAMILRGRIPWAIAWLTLAALAKEASLIVAFGSAFWVWHRGERRDALWMFSVPVFAVGLWAIYVRWRIGWTLWASVGSVGLPLRGLFDAFPGWMNQPIHLVAGISMILLLALFLRRSLRDTSLVSWAFVGFAVLGVFLVREVWQAYYDITRVIAPLTTAFVLMVFLDARSDQGSRVQSLEGSAVSASRQL